MIVLLICGMSAAVGAVTLVSGFGLGTLLLPAMAMFFPLEVAIAATAVVHLANSVFRLALVGRHADRGTVLAFGVPAAVAALAGAAVMLAMGRFAPLVKYDIGRVQCEITLLKLAIGLLLAGLAALELWPAYQRLRLPRRAMPIGGLVSGFVGGISGIQGAIRAPFLLRTGLEPNAYAGTTSWIAAVVDVMRLCVYAIGFTSLAPQRYDAMDWARDGGVVAAACLSAMLGSSVGALLIRRTTMRAIRYFVAGLLFVSAGMMLLGLV